MRKIDEIIIHCSATREGCNYNASDIDRWHKQRGFSMIGYHFVILLDGSIEIGRTPDMIGAHCKGHNSNSIGICYIGGLDKDGIPKDTRTENQKISLRKLVSDLKELYPQCKVIGHRDTSPDLNKDGLISSNEWIKQCPCFDVKTEL